MVQKVRSDLSSASILSALQATRQSAVMKTGDHRQGASREEESRGTGRDGVTDACRVTCDIKILSDANLC
eukprot:755043-Hanusia_phi.AAC.1